jgi:nucleotide-binding universal stress UspA family protein
MGDELTYGFVMPFFPVFPIIAIVCQAVLAAWLIHMSLIAWIVVPVWILSGVGIYYFYSKSHVLATEHDITVLEEEGAPEGDEYRIMVAVANPKNAIQMVRTTYRLCDATHARVKLLHMVPVPDQVPLTDAEKYMLEGKEAIVEAMLYLEPLFPITTIISYCRNVARGIVNAVREKKIDMLIVGWYGRSRTYGFSFGSTIDPIIERSPCNVVVLKGGGNQKFKRILVPVAGGPNGGFALEIASMLAEKEEGAITAFTVVTDQEKFDIVGFVSEHKERLQVPSEHIAMKAVNATNVVDAILKEAEEYDLVVIGCTRKPRIYQVTRESIPETIARRCPQPLVMVNAAKGIQSWIKRWI